MVKVEQQRAELITWINDTEYMNTLEMIGRVCYKSEKKIKKDSAKKFVERLIKNKHESVLEHLQISVRLITDRGVSHELVRHRIAAYSQESTRYVNYMKGITVILPVELEKEYTEKQEKKSLKQKMWESGMLSCQLYYMGLIHDHHVTPQFARSVLPMALKTELVATMNLRQWRHVLKLRTSKYAHPQMRDLMEKVLKLFKEKLPVIFGDIT